MAKNSSSSLELEDFSEQHALKFAARILSSKDMQAAACRARSTSVPEVCPKSCVQLPQDTTFRISVLKVAVTNVRVG